MLRTNSAVYRTRVRDYLLHDDRLPDGWPKDFSLLATDVTAMQGNAGKWGEAMRDDLLRFSRALYLATMFDSEVNKHQRQHIPNLQDRVEHWLAGLTLNIAYTYPDIAATARRLHAPHKLTDDQLDRIQDQWFEHLTLHLMRIWRSYGIEVPA